MYAIRSYYEDGFDLVFGRERSGDQVVEFEGFGGHITESLFADLAVAPLGGRNNFV